QGPGPRFRRWSGGLVRRGSTPSLLAAARLLVPPERAVLVEGGNALFGGHVRRACLVGGDPGDAHTERRHGNGEGQYSPSRASHGCHSVLDCISLVKDAQ